MAKKKAAKKTKKPVRKAKKSARKKPAPKISPEKQVEKGLLLGEVEDYFAHVNVIALTLKKPLAVGDTIRVKGHTTDVTQQVDSIQIDHQAVQTAAAKDGVGIKIAGRARKGDAVYKI